MISESARSGDGWLEAREIDTGARLYSRCRRFGGALVFLMALVTVSLDGAHAVDTPESGLRLEIGAPQPSAAQIAVRSEESQREERRARKPERTGRRRLLDIDYPFSAFRLGISVAGLALFAWGLRRASERSRRATRLRLTGLVLLALVSYSSYYHFFRVQKPGGFDSFDTYHYYVASKYSPELGYFRLYECSLAVLVEAGRPPGANLGVRNMRTLRVEKTRAALERARTCKGDFRSERWEQFKHDVLWFRARIFDQKWSRAMIDYGYNPSPVWTLIARPVSSAVAVESGWLPYLVRMDRVLIAVAFVAVGWAFGLEAAALMALAWGTCFLWRYGWIGDGYLRQVWFSAAILGLCCARKSAFLASGFLLSLSSLLRLFPGVFVAAFTAHALRRLWQERRLSGAARRFAAGVVTAVVILVPGSLVVSGRGPSILPDFAAKIVPFATQPAPNKVGLSALTWELSHLGTRFLTGRPSVVKAGRRRADPTIAAGMRAIELATIGWFLFLFWRGIRRAENWEAAAMGFTLIPILSQPTNYYFPFVLSAALLATRRPRIGVILLLACIAWGLNGLYFYGEVGEFTLASLISVILSLLVVREMARPVERVTPRSG